MQKMWSSCCSWAVLLLWLWQLQADIFCEMHNFAIIVTQWWAPPFPPFSACFKAVTCVAFSLLFVTAGLSLSCSSTVELEGISHHHLMFTIFNVTFYHQPAGTTEVPSYSLNNINSAIKLSVLMCFKCAELLFLAESLGIVLLTQAELKKKKSSEEVGTGRESVGDSGHVQAACREGCCWNEQRLENTNSLLWMLMESTN